MKKYSLPKEFAEKWVQALRTTPEEKHAVGRLISFKAGNVKYCALGLAANVLGFENSELILKKSLTVNLAKRRYIPIELVGAYKANKLAHALTLLNDVGDLTFIEIADWIEQNVNFI